MRQPMNLSSIYLGTVVAALAGACGANSGPEPEGTSEHYYPTSSVVFGDDGQSTYVSLLRSLDSQEIDPAKAREFAGWADMWVHDGKVFMTDGEAPELTRYSVTQTGSLVEEGRLSFQNYGTDTAAFWRNRFVASDKAYLFVMDERRIVVWDPSAMRISRTFDLPELADRGAHTPYVTIDRGAIVRGNRLYATVGWGDWDNYSLANDSVILVIDTEHDEVVDVLAVPCPDLNVASMDDRGDIYFSNWVYGIGPSLFEAGAATCAVRVKAGENTLDDSWSLAFAEVTGGRQAAALRLIGGGKALISVFHHERVEITPEADRWMIADSANWRSWTLDVDTLEAAELDGLDWHAGGFYASRIDGRNHVFIPSADYSSTKGFELFPSGAVEPRWTATGWVTRLFKVR